MSSKEPTYHQKTEYDYIEKNTDNYPPEEIAKIIAKANVALLRLKSLTPGYDMKVRRLTRLSKYLVLLTITLLVSLLFNLSFIEDIFPRFFDIENKYLILRVTYILFLVTILIFLADDIYRSYKTKRQLIFLAQAELFKDRLKILLSRLEKEYAKPAKSNNH